MFQPSNGLTAEVIRDVMPRHRLSPDLLATAVAAHPPSPPGICWPWRQAKPRARANKPDRRPPALSLPPKPTFPRINPMNPEPAAAPTQNVVSALSRINPVNPEPGAAPAPNPGFTLSRINPVNPELAAAPTQNPASALSRINPKNPEPHDASQPPRPTQAKPAPPRRPPQPSAPFRPPPVARIVVPVLTCSFLPNGPAGVAWKTGTSRGGHAPRTPHGPHRHTAPQRSLLACCLLLATLVLAGCAQSPEGTCALAWRATLPIDPRDNLIFLGAMFNDQPATMLMDTGAERTTLTEAAVTRLRLHRDLEHPTNTFGIGGPSASYEAIPDDFAVGVFRLPVKRVKVGTFALPAFGGVQPDGLLGADILLAFDLDIDLPAHRLTIYRARSCANSKPPWTEPYSSVEGVGMWRDRLVVPLSINGADGRAVLDTGAQRSVLRPAYAARAGVTQAMLNTDPSHQMRGASRDEISFRLHRFDTVRIGTQIAHDVSLPVAPLPGGEEDALIGGDFLHGRRIWLSAASHQMFFTAPQP